MIFARGRIGEDGVRNAAVADRVLAHVHRHRYHRRHRLDAGNIDFRKLLDEVENGIELPAQMLDLIISNRDARQMRDAADGMGLSPRQRLLAVELPLAAPIILAGVRVSVTISIGTATIGATVGALTLGTPILDGLAANNLPFVIEGAVLAALFAILTDLLFAALDRRLRRGERAASSLDRVVGVCQRLASEGPRFVRTVLHGGRSSSGSGGGAGNAT